MMTVVSPTPPAAPVAACSAPIATGNVAWMEAMTKAAKCGEWLAMQGYQLIGLEIDHCGPCIRIAHSTRAERHLEGANVGRICLGGQTRMVYAARRFDCAIKWEVITCN
jgi:hypothetical protein